MYYQTVNISAAGHPVPEGGPGFDRLSWVSPETAINQKISDMISRQVMPRYLGPNDYSRMLPSSSQVAFTFPTMAGAEEWQDFCLTLGSNTGTNQTISCTIQDVPEYPIPPEAYQL